MIAHLPVMLFALPVLLASLILMNERGGMVLQRSLGLAGGVLWVALAALLVGQVADGTILVYLLGDWAAHLGIALAVDRLGAGMVLLTSVLGLLALVYACDGWDRRVSHFHSLFQLQIAGINGAFLTGDLFNLFVCFEVMLIASYGLLLGGGWGSRMRAGLRYVSLNIALSLVFLIGIAVLYGVTGTLNMAELAARIAVAPEASLGLIQIGAGMLLVVFCAKAALMPLYLWLPQTYAAAPAAVVALFVLLTKVGVYSYLRVFGTLFGDTAGELAGLGREWLLPLATVGALAAAAGAIAVPSLRRLAGYMVVLSSATLFIAFSVPSVPAWTAGLYYMAHSVVGGAALFLIVDQITRQRADAHDSLLMTDVLRQPNMLGLLFVAVAVAVIGLPPLSGFVGKLAILGAMPDAFAVWAWPAILVSSLGAIIAFARAGGRVFWKMPTGQDCTALPAHPVQLGVACALLALSLLLSLAASPVLSYAEAGANQLLAPEGYIDAVRGALPRAQEASP